VSINYVIKTGVNEKQYIKHGTLTPNYGVTIFGLASNFPEANPKNSFFIFERVLLHKNPYE